MWTIRPFEPNRADYQAISDIANAAYPEQPVVPESFRFRDSLQEAGYHRARFIVERDGRPVGDGICTESQWTHLHGRFYVEHTLHPDFASPALDEVCHTYAKALASEHEIICWEAATRENRTSRVEFLEDRGFKQVFRVPISWLRVDAFDWTRFGGLPAQVESQGIRLSTVADLKREDPDWLVKLHDLGWAVDQDMPSVDPPRRMSLSTFARLLKGPHVLLDAAFVALDGDQWVGISGLKRDLADPTRLEVTLTGVLRSHRRRHIATALKVMATAYARDVGARIIQTDNEENNPMFDLNLTLGFEPRPALVFFQKGLE